MTKKNDNVIRVSFCHCGEFIKCPFASICVQLSIKWPKKYFECIHGMVGSKQTKAQLILCTTQVKN